MKQTYTPDKKDRYFSRAVSNALKILDLLRAEPTPLGLSEITRKTGINKTSIFRFLYTMEVTGHVIRDETGRYNISGSGLEYSPEITPDRIKEAALPHMRKLRSSYSETVSLGVLLKNHIEVIQVLEGPHLIRMSNQVGRIIPPHASSIGKAITAFQDEAKQERLVNSFGMLRLTEKTILDEGRLKQEYSEIRRMGWSHDNRESAIEGECFGAPIQLRGKTVASVSISFPVFRGLEGKKLQVMLEDLKTTAKNVSVELENPGIRRKETK
ncbi:MAG: IclR family transcriptional regulator [Acidobacteriota bacterium]